MGSGGKQDHLTEVSGLPTGFLLILQEQKPAKLLATTARQLNNSNNQGKIKLTALMSAADPAQAFGQQPPPSPIVAHHLLSASSPLTAPKLPNCKLLACTSCTLAWLKKDQIGLWRTASVKHHIKQVERTTKRFPHVPNAGTLYKRVQTAELQPPTPQSH